MSTSPDAGPARAPENPVRPLPARPSLEYERKEAKKLIRRVHAGDVDALQRVRSQWHGGLRDASTLRLADAQLAIAREYGFASWPKLVSYFETLHRHERSHQRSLNPSDFYEQRVKSLLIEHRDRRPGIGEMFATFVPRLYGKTAAEALESTITIDDARLVVARESMFASWDAMIDRARSNQGKEGRNWERQQSPFWRALGAIQAGDLGALATVVDNHPELVGDAARETQPDSLIRSAVIAEMRERTTEAREITDWLASRGDDLGTTLNRVLCLSFRTQMRDVEFLLSRGADPNWIAPNGYSAFEHALVRYWNRDAVDLLTPRVVPRKAFWIAAGIGDVEAVSRYVGRNGKVTAAARKHRPDFTAMGPGLMPSLPDAMDVEIMWEAFYVAALNGRVAVVDMLLERGFPIDYTLGGITMLSFAIGNRMVALVEHLVRRGASLDLRGWRPSMTPREMAQWHYQSDPANPDARRLLELCDGGDPDEVLRAYEAKRAATRPVATPGLRMEIALAVEEAARLGQDAVEPHNLFVAMLNARSSSIIGVLRKAGADVDRVVDALRPRLLSSELTKPAEPVAGPALSPAARDVIDRATDEAAARRQTAVYSGHVLFAMGAMELGAIAEVLAAAGTTPVRVREAARELL